jgi:hypothetical protein
MLPSGPLSLPYNPEYDPIPAATLTTLLCKGLAERISLQKCDRLGAVTLPNQVCAVSRGGMTMQ